MIKSFWMSIRSRAVSFILVCEKGTANAEAQRPRRRDVVVPIMMNERCGRDQEAVKVLGSLKVAKIRDKAETKYVKRRLGSGQGRHEKAYLCLAVSHKRRDRRARDVPPVQNNRCRWASRHKAHAR